TDLDDRDQTEAIDYISQLGQKPTFDHDVIELEGDSALRVRPNTPLDPLSRYIVVVTDGVTDVSGEPIVGSPSYQNLKEADNPNGNSALDPVQSLIAGFWEEVSNNYFAVTNSSREALGLPALSKENIALSYSFTTSEDKKVLSHIANPANWVADQLRRSVSVGAAEAAIEGGADGFGDVFAAVTGALSSFKPSVELDNEGLEDCDTSPFLGFADKFVCAGTLAKQASLDPLLASQGQSFPQPSVRDIDLPQTDDALSVSAVLSSLDIEPGQVDVHQGSISLPQYIAVPDETQTGETSTIRTKSWRPDVPVAGLLGEALDATIPQEDPDVSEVLNYNFPFPKLEGEVDVPMLVITPAGLDPLNDEAELIPVIFQHGITTDRSAALAFGTQLVAAAQALDPSVNLAVFAIDQPLHGVSPFSDEQQLETSKSLIEAAVINALLPDGFDSIDDLEEANPDAAANIKAQAESVADTLAPGAIASLSADDPVASFTTQVEAVEAELEAPGLITGAPGFETTAAVLLKTVRYAGSTIPGLAPASTATGVVEGVNERHYGFTAGADGNPVAMDFEEGVGSSGSLFINLTNFMNNRDVLRQGSVDLMNLTATVNNLPGVAGTGVTFIGHSLGTLNGGAFVGAAAVSGNEDLFVSGAHLLTPVAGTTRLLENSPSFAPTILGGLQRAAGLTQGDADLETFLNVNQASLDSVDPINFANELAVSNTVLAQVEGDRTTPNAADTRYGDDKGPLNITFPNGLTVRSPEAPLSGSEALAAVMGAIPTDIPLDTPMITRYEEGVHGTPVLPQEEEAEAGDVLKDRTFATGGEVIVSGPNAEATFGTMVQQTLLLIQSSQTPE
ncbi:hypothetical protein, partial [Marinobacter sp.]|uniref:hypothetical protein n=1 Tax=Marinobacter sp. TaxID=50741 RepID=UPI003561A395